MKNLLNRIKALFKKRELAPIPDDGYNELIQREDEIQAQPLPEDYEDVTSASQEEEPNVPYMYLPSEDCEELEAFPVSKRSIDYYVAKPKKAKKKASKKVSKKKVTKKKKTNAKSKRK